MSVVVAMRARSGIYMAADTQVTDDSGHKTYDVNKVFEGKDYLLGVAGDFKIVSLMSYFSFSWKSDRNKFMVKELPLLIREYLAPYVTDSNDPETRDEYSILVAHKGGICEITDTNEAFIAPIFHTVGSGAPYAFGSYSTSKMWPNFDDEMTVKTCVNAAIQNDAYCGGGVYMSILPD